MPTNCFHDLDPVILTGIFYGFTTFSSSRCSTLILYAFIILRFFRLLLFTLSTKNVNLPIYGFYFGFLRFHTPFTSYAFTICLRWVSQYILWCGDCHFDDSLLTCLMTFRDGKKGDLWPRRWVQCLNSFSTWTKTLWPWEPKHGNSFCWSQDGNIKWELVMRTWLSIIPNAAHYTRVWSGQQNTGQTGGRQHR